MSASQESLAAAAHASVQEEDELPVALADVYALVERTLATTESTSQESLEAKVHAWLEEEKEILLLHLLVHQASCCWAAAVATVLA